MVDLVYNLRRQENRRERDVLNYRGQLLGEAADEIERLRACLVERDLSNREFQVEIDRLHAWIECQYPGFCLEEIMVMFDKKTEPS